MGALIPDGEEKRTTPGWVRVVKRFTLRSYGLGRLGG
ncbi:hypothetical protein KN1_12630 [Stygiolobus caldivivus]|uniref:Uncharacterized protein n=1 Tax=Stygiolobus caldivivus TaxID=2824673 RepID=A0A8D5U6Y4_9CREN|nr:hypothetical protein KN1_12630 [Stygiolobus caldivivus]